MIENKLRISNKSMVAIKASLLAAVLIGLVVFTVNVIPVFAAHTATVTITPDIANCDQLGNTFTVKSWSSIAPAIIDGSIVTEEL